MIFLATVSVRGSARSVSRSSRKAASKAVTKTSIEGEPPSPVLPPPGCRFNTRCPAAQDVCRAEEPQLRELEPGERGVTSFGQDAAGELHLLTEEGNVYRIVAR